LNDARDGVDLAPLARQVGFALSLARSTIADQFGAVFGEDGPRPAAYAVLAALAENPGARQGAVARALHIKDPNMAKLVRALVARGLVERCVPPDDRRAVDLSLTRAGREALAGWQPGLDEVERRLTAALSGRERARLLDLLAKLLSGQDEAGAVRRGDDDG